jgi:hypothetical protein
MVRIGGRVCQRANNRLVPPFGLPGAKISKKLRPCILTGAKENSICMSRSFIRQRCRVKPSKYDKNSIASIMISNPVSSMGRRNIRLNDNQVRVIIQFDPFNMFIDEENFIIIVKIACQGSQSDGRKQRVFYRAKKGLVASVRAGSIIFTFMAKMILDYTLYCHVLSY